MSPVGIAAYLADAWCIGAFWLLQRNIKYRRFYMAANFFGAIPLGATELLAHNWQAFILNDAFGLIGLKGMFSGTK